MKLEEKRNTDVRCWERKERTYTKSSTIIKMEGKFKKEHPWICKEHVKIREIEQTRQEKDIRKENAVHTYLNMTYSMSNIIEKNALDTLAPFTQPV